MPKATASHGASLDDRFEAGKALRDKVPRTAQAIWKRPADRPDPVAILQASDPDRLPELVPIRYGRMLQSPFAFYRGAAAVMAGDLARMPSTGLHVQACGDCHLSNFGGFASPERNVLFDINDFDETLPAPWEWDVKRLVASFVLASRANGLADKDGRAAAIACARSYRKRLREFARMSPLDVWYARITAEDVAAEVPPAAAERLRARVSKAMDGS
ncbi:MAG: DUF2252 domain-containing protein, partial [Roseomonas sp.]|nr:DUF2252 domain-containing protein [Roseomonas sp.]